MVVPLPSARSNAALTDSFGVGVVGHTSCARLVSAGLRAVDVDYLTGTAAVLDARIVYAVGAFGERVEYVNVLRNAAGTLVACDLASCTIGLFALSSTVEGRLRDGERLGVGAVTAAGSAGTSRGPLAFAGNGAGGSGRAGGLAITFGLQRLRALVILKSLAVELAGRGLVAFNSTCGQTAFGWASVQWCTRSFDPLCALALAFACAGGLAAGEWRKSKLEGFASGASYPVEAAVEYLV